MNHKPILCTAVLLGALLLGGCGAERTNVVSSGNSDASVSSGDAYATYGDAYASAGDAYVTDGDVYATSGNAYATSGNASPSRTVTVSTVDELLDAVAPDTEVVLEPGTYDLTKADSAKLHDYCYWKPTGYSSDWSLVFSNLYNFRLAGSTGERADVQLLFSPLSGDGTTMAPVLTFENCSSLNLSGFTAGHEKGAVCSAGVLSFTGCSGVYVGGCELYGCGTIGVAAENCYSLTVADTLVRDCSYNGVSLSSCADVLLDGCELRNCGSSILSLYQTRGAEFRNCLLRENREAMDLLCCAYGNTGVLFDDCTFRDNSTACLFSIAGGESPSFNGCTFADNTVLSSVYANTGDTFVPVLVDGEALYGSPEEDATPAPARERQKVTVSTAQALLAAIAPDTEIVLSAGTYDLTALMNGENGLYYSWREVYNATPAAELVVEGVSNLSLTAAPNCTVEIVTTPRYANVLNFQDCSGVSLSGLTVGHSEGPGTCTGSVLRFEDCSNADVDGCELYGCGTYGVSAQDSRNLAVSATVVRDCSLGVYELVSCRNVSFTDCNFHDNATDDPFYAYESYDLSVVNCLLDGSLITK